MIDSFPLIIIVTYVTYVCMHTYLYVFPVYIYVCSGSGLTILHSTTNKRVWGLSISPIAKVNSPSPSSNLILFLILNNRRWLYISIIQIMHLSIGNKNQNNQLPSLIFHVYSLCKIRCVFFCAFSETFRNSESRIFSINMHTYNQVCL